MPTASPAAIKITGMDLIGATVPDIKRSLAFYRDTLGLVPASVSDDGAEFHFSDGTTFGLWQPPAGYPHRFAIMFSVADARAAGERFRELGATIGEATESPVCFMAVGTDPEGNGIIAHQRKTHDEHRPPQQQRTPTTIYGIDLAGYLVSDPQGEAAFYREVLGLQPTQIDEQGRGAEFELADGSTFGVWEGNTCGFTMFAVEDAKAKTDELRARGVEISPLTETPACHMAYCADPDGNAVIIHQRKHR
ncbi:MAG TPA: VOC family protein [Candidatus Aquilonibacter sp.]